MYSFLEGGDMDKLLEEIRKLEENIETARKAYEDDCLELFKQPGFDIYKRKWDKKLEKLAEKHAPLLAELVDKHKELKLEYEQKLDEKRRSLFRDP